MSRTCLKARHRHIGKLLLALFATSLSTLSLSADQAGFSGRVVIEVLDGIEFAQKLGLLKDIAFTDADGKIWRARKGGILDGETVPRDLYSVIGLPYPSEYRKAAVVHDYFCRARTEAWRQVHRTLAALRQEFNRGGAKQPPAFVFPLVVLPQQQRLTLLHFSF